MNEHVVDFRESGHPDGMIAALLTHHEGKPLDWTDDGLTCAPATPCSAIAAVSNERCGKREAVVFLSARSKYAQHGSGVIDVFLCGGHFNSHRAGREVRVVVTPGRAR